MSAPGEVVPTDEKKVASRILYIVSLFPCWSETFIVREIATLIQAGADVRILSLKRPHEKLVQEDAERLLSRARHPQPGLAAAREWLSALAARPLALSRASLRVLSRQCGRPLDLAKSLGALARGFEHLSWVRAFDPDIIYAHWATYPSTVAWAMADVLGKPFGFTSHAHDIFVNDHLLKEKIESARLAVTISRYNVEWLAEKRTPVASRKMQVVHCGVDVSTMPFRAEGRDRGLIVAVGRLDPIKGFGVLVEAVGHLIREGRSVKCRIIGEGPLEPSLRDDIRRGGLSGIVELAGALPQAEVRKALYAASVFVLPSVVTASGDRDGIPVSLMEAMAAGTPCVSTRVSGIPELIEDEVEGLLVPQRDGIALARAIARALDEPELARRLAAAARAKVEKEFDSAREARKLLDLLRRAAE